MVHDAAVKGGTVDGVGDRQLLDLCWKAWDLDDAGKIGEAGAAA